MNKYALHALQLFSEGVHPLQIKRYWPVSSVISATHHPTMMKTVTLVDTFLMCLAGKIRGVYKTSYRCATGKIRAKIPTCATAKVHNKRYLLALPLCKFSTPFAKSWIHPCNTLLLCKKSVFYFGILKHTPFLSLQPFLGYHLWSNNFFTHVLKTPLTLFCYF